MLPCCLYYVDKITLVRRKKYKVHNVSGKFSHPDIWKICTCNSHQQKSHFIKTKFYPKFQEEKKHGVCVSGVCLRLSVGIGSSIHQDETIPECFILLQASHLKALFLSAMEAILICSKCGSAVKPPSGTNSSSHALPQILLFISRAFANVWNSWRNPSSPAPTSRFTKRIFNEKVLCYQEQHA